MTVDSSSHSHHTSDQSAVDHGADIDRREFLRRSGLATLACGGAAGVLSGCTVPLRSLRVTSAKNVAVQLADYPELSRPGGMLKIIHPTYQTIFVRHESEGEYVAFSGICPHQGCTVDSTRHGFQCPCHNATFDRNGKRKSGPSRDHLMRFDIAAGDSQVTIQPSNELAEGW